MRYIIFNSLFSEPKKEKYKNNKQRSRKGEELLLHKFQAEDVDVVGDRGDEQKKDME